MDSYNSIQQKNLFNRGIRRLRLELSEILKPKDESISPRKIDKDVMDEYRSYFYIEGIVDLILHDPLSKPQSVHDSIPESLIQTWRHLPNTVVDAGEIWMAELLAHTYKQDDATLGGVLLDGVGGTSSDVAVGTGSVGVTQTDLDLGTPVTDAVGGLQPTATTFIGTDKANKFKVSGFYDVGDASNPDPTLLREAALFATNRESVAPGPKDKKTQRMFNRTVFAVISKSATTQLTIQWTIEIGSVA